MDELLNLLSVQYDPKIENDWLWIYVVGKNLSKEADYRILFCRNYPNPKYQMFSHKDIQFQI